MNLNVGGFSETLKCSYQQFCKQEAEGRDSSRRLLVKLKKFEAKAFDLVAQTQSAQQMRNQFEKTLMQQNPLFWAQIQRNIATDVADFNLECPLLSGCSGTKHTREMAVNTSCNSSTSEPHSLHEEGIWPHTPSPIADMDLQQLSHSNARHTKMFSSTPHNKDNKEHQNVKKDRKITNSNSMPTHKEHIPSSQGYRETKHSLTSILDIHHPTVDILTPQQVNQCVSTNNAIPNVTIKDEASGMLPSTANITIEAVNEELDGRILEHHLVQKDQTEILSQLSKTEIKHPSTGMTEVLVTDSITCKSQDTNNDKDDGIKELQSNIAAVDEVTVPVIAPPSPNKIKPFRLDSDSDCGDDPISGPLSGKNVGDDDSDSFWN